MIALGWVSNVRGKMPDVVESQVVRDGTANRDFATNINKNSDRAIYQVRMLPDRIVDLLAYVVLGSFHAGQFEYGEQHGQQQAA